MTTERGEDVKPVKTEGVDISPEAVEVMAAHLESDNHFPQRDANKCAEQIRALRTALTASEKRIAELEAKVQDKRDDYEAGWYARIEAEGRF